MTIKHEDQTRITELGDCKVMKQTLDDCYIDCFIENDVKPNFLYDGAVYLIRCICAVCGFCAYFMYKDYFSAKGMIALICAIYYALCGVDYFITYVFIKHSFLIGSLPSGSKYSDATDFRAESSLDFGEYIYTLTLSALVGKERVQHIFKKPVGSYYESDGLLRRDVVRVDASAVMDEFRVALHNVVTKKSE